MNLLDLALLQRDDWSGWIWFAIFVLVPLLGRLLRWVLVRAGLAQPEADPATARRTARQAMERRRAEQREAEAEGGDLWRRLARGELMEPPPPPPAPKVAPPPSRVPVEGPVHETSLEGAAEPAPLSILGEIREPSSAAEVSLESEAEPVALEALSAPAPAMEVEGMRLRGFVLGRRELRRAMILTEILGPPVCDRPFRA